MKVLIKITPLAPLEPYIAVADASFKTVILSISAGLIEFKAFLEPPTPPSFNGTPSTTINGEFVKDKDPKPRILMAWPSPGAPLPEVTETPASFPDISCSGDKTGPVLKSSDVIRSAAPVRSSLVTEPYPINRTSSNCEASSDIETLNDNCPL